MATVRQARRACAACYPRVAVCPPSHGVRPHPTPLGSLSAPSACSPTSQQPVRLWLESAVLLVPHNWLSRRLGRWLRAWAALNTLKERPSQPEPSTCTRCGRQPMCYSRPVCTTNPARRILSSPPHPIQPSTPPIQPSALAWQWGGTKRACSVVLVLLVGCVLPGGGASTSPAAPTTGASLEGSSDFSSPGRGLSDSMAKVREREATAALGCLPKVLAAGCPKSQVLALIMRIGRRPLSSTY